MKPLPSYVSPRGPMRGKLAFYRARLRRVIDGAGVSYVGEVWGCRVRVEKHPRIPETLELSIEIKSAFSASRPRTRPRNCDRAAILDFTAEQEAEAFTP